MKAPRSRAAPVTLPLERRSFITPEGVDLRLEVGSYVERLLALMLDALIIVA